VGGAVMFHIPPSDTKKREQNINFSQELRRDFFRHYDRTRDERVAIMASMSRAIVRKSTASFKNSARVGRQPEAGLTSFFWLHVRCAWTAVYDRLI
jgi:hypothetical protein